MDYRVNRRRSQVWLTALNARCWNVDRSTKYRTRISFCVTGVEMKIWHRGTEECTDQLIFRPPCPQFDLDARLANSNIRLVRGRLQFLLSFSYFLRRANSTLKEIDSRIFLGSALLIFAVCVLRLKSL